ncbi:MAG TPA: hypothetical protein VLA54_12175 [Acidimicrobiia bacterium]|nr:hypothetical protein [Acidimicrobiia bacterium]
MTRGVVLLLVAAACSQVAEPVSTSQLVTTTTTPVTTSTSVVTARAVLDALVVGGLVLDDTVSILDWGDRATEAATPDHTRVAVMLYPTVEDATAAGVDIVNTGLIPAIVFQCQTILVEVVARPTEAGPEAAARVVDLIRPTLETHYGPC